MCVKVHSLMVKCWQTWCDKHDGGVSEPDRSLDPTTTLSATTQSVTTEFGLGNLSTNQENTVGSHVSSNIVYKDKYAEIFVSDKWQRSQHGTNEVYTLRTMTGNVLHSKSST